MMTFPQASILLSLKQRATPAEWQECNLLVFESGRASQDLHIRRAKHFLHPYHHYSQTELTNI